MKINLHFKQLILLLIIFLISHNMLFSQEDGCINDDNYIASVFSSLTECDQTVNFLMTNYGFTNEEACNWDGANFGPGLAFPNGLGSVCECSCQTQSSSCDEGYTLLTLNYYDAAQNSFTVTNSIGDVIASYSILNGDGVLEDCFLTSSQADCFSIDIDGGQDFSWYLSSDETVILQGGSEDFEFGPDCDDCNDNDGLVEQYFGNFFVTECSSLIDYLIANYNYTSSQACNWNGAPMADFGGLIISDFCECSCQENTSIMNHKPVQSNLIMVKDLMGRDVTKMTTNTPLLFIYDDGTIKKTIIKN